MLERRTPSWVAMNSWVPWICSEICLLPSIEVDQRGKAGDGKEDVVFTFIVQPVPEVQLHGLAMRQQPSSLDLG